MAGMRIVVKREHENYEQFISGLAAYEFVERFCGEYTCVMPFVSEADMDTVEILFTTTKEARYFCDCLHRFMGDRRDEGSDEVNFAANLKAMMDVALAHPETYLESDGALRIYLDLVCGDISVGLSEDVEDTSDGERTEQW